MKTKAAHGIDEEFDRQVNNLLVKEYPRLAGWSRKKFREFVEPLRQRLKELPAPKRPLPEGRLVFVIVIPSCLVAADAAMRQVERQGKRGLSRLEPVAADDFTPIKGVKVPRDRPYLLVDIDRGAATLNVRPEDALKIIRQRRRSPLTLEEGIAVLTHFPDFLQKNNCFSLPGSRRGDQRVPALWLSKNTPKLGWCWDRNPHTWLGSASCLRRIG